MSAPLDLSAGLCANDDPKQWDGPGTPYAHGLCSVCPVKTECLGEAMENMRYQDGMRAGVWFDNGEIRTRRERHLEIHNSSTLSHLVAEHERLELMIAEEMERIAKTTRDPARCGTDSGYQGHRRRNESACKPCRDAHCDKEKQRRSA